MYVPTGLIFSIAIIIIAFVAKVPTYKVSPVFLIPILWAPYALRRWLHLHPFHYLLFALALLLHDLGAFGLYQRGVFGVSFDIYVHFYFAFVATFVIYRALEHHLGLRPWQTALFTLLFIMGFGGIHEVMEYASYLLLGEERGMLKPHTAYILDTSRDLTNNFLGCLAALLIHTILRAFRRPLP
ncbi:MAG TPA: DUF2238 domain-containing protein [Tepidisphaeraceae bacterium]|jgi:uncharacterized membrane protein YjdF|nr:DUF2238 domain-containing protein [Tepidisphaeraceae bacterium]